MNMIKVVDQFGRSYSDTYPKRAKGLVKNNRAYWVDDEHTTICLVSPHSIISEEKTMKLTNNEIQKMINLLQSDMELYSSGNFDANDSLSSILLTSCEEVINHYNYCLKKAIDSEIDVMFLDYINLNVSDDVKQYLGVYLTRCRGLINVLKGELDSSEVTQDSNNNQNSQNDQNDFDLSNIYKYALQTLKNIDINNGKPIVTEIMDNVSDIVTDVKEEVERYLEDACDEIDDKIDDIEDELEEMEESDVFDEKRRADLLIALVELKKAKEKIINAMK